MRFRHVLIALVLLAGCDVGSIANRQEPTGDGAEPDGTGGGDLPDGPDAASVACDEPVASAASGEHHAGDACLGCHGGGGDAPRFSLGGTLFDALAAGGPVVGATIRVVDAAGVEVALHSARNGNFWAEQDLSFPLTVLASSCPDTRAMVAPVQQAGADCNAGGCHDADFQIHLP